MRITRYLSSLTLFLTSFANKYFYLRETDRQTDRDKEIKKSERQRDRRGYSGTGTSIKMEKDRKIGTVNRVIRFIEIES
jgi:hypothetical protein